MRRRMFFVPKCSGKASNVECHRWGSSQWLTTAFFTRGLIVWRPLHTAAWERFICVVYSSRAGQKGFDASLMSPGRCGPGLFYLCGVFFAWSNDGLLASSGGACMCVQPGQKGHREDAEVRVICCVQPYSGCILAPQLAHATALVVDLSAAVGT